MEEDVIERRPEGAGRQNARDHRRALDDPHPARASAAWSAQIPGPRAGPVGHQSEYAVAAAQDARGARDARAAVLYGAPAARRVPADGQGARARAGPQGVVRMVQEVFAVKPSLTLLAIAGLALE